MRWLAVFTVCMSLGGLGALAVGGSGAVESPAEIKGPADVLPLPAAPFSGWVDLGWTQDPLGRWVASGYRMDPRPVAELADTIIEHWAAKGRGGRVIPLADGGAFLSSVDVSAGDQVLYTIEDRGPLRTILVGRVTFNGAPSNAQNHIGPALGGLGSASVAHETEGFNQAIEAQAAALTSAGWRQIQAPDEGQRAKGRASQTWRQGHQTLQVEHVKMPDGRVLRREQRLPAAEPGR